MDFILQLAAATVVFAPAAVPEIKNSGIDCNEPDNCCDNIGE